MSNILVVPLFVEKIGNENVSMGTSMTTVGSQFDNNATVFVFDRPDVFQNANVTATFDDGVNAPFVLDVGTERAFSLSGLYTTQFSFTLTLTFEQDGVSENTNPLIFRLRAGQVSDTNTESDINDIAVTTGDCVDGVLRFFNRNGTQVFSIDISGKTTP